MSQKSRQKLTLDRPVTYQIKVPGELAKSWSEWIGNLTIAVERDDDGLPVTVLTLTVDQAALQGLLRSLYSMGVPLISVILIDYR
ncbi:MAG: hypothetical protein PVJ21_10570 [Anaerolineales bacterium]|jgi:hypothetical protein